MTINRSAKCEKYGYFLILQHAQYWEPCFTGLHPVYTYYIKPPQRKQPGASLHADLALNAEACLNNRTFQTVEQEKLKRKFRENNSCALLGAGKLRFILPCKSDCQPIFGIAQFVTRFTHV